MGETPVKIDLEQERPTMQEVVDLVAAVAMEIIDQVEGDRILADEMVTNLSGNLDNLGKAEPDLRLRAMMRAVADQLVAVDVVRAKLDRRESPRR